MERASDTLCFEVMGPGRLIAAFQGDTSFSRSPIIKCGERAGRQGPVLCLVSDS